MNDEDALNELVGALRSDALTQAQRDTVRGGLAPLLGGGTTGGGGGGTVASGIGAKAALGVLGLGAFLAFGGVGLWLGIADPTPAPPQLQPNIAMSGEAPEGPAAVGEAPNEEATPLVDDEPDADAPAPRDPRRRARRRQRPAPEVVEAETTAPAADPVAEHTLLARARAALNRSPRQALALTEEHRLGFPSGVLAQERELIAIEALVRLDRRPAARTRASQLVSRWPGSPYVSRVNELGLLSP